ncbi:tyrosine-protein phosphatase [Chitinophaga horti]|uniref:Tyrosine-protein phosphatase n=1 Tax=Chitinophaga horti TaxID=2920382 RepID=A0ABY6IXA9_9BACT|nr:tyrosine-protein phosphatase [Chitinophaga horti]UYQ91930.1 tyrosine-protein phosphatase [Chitinophaga horti]
MKKMILLALTAMPFVAVAQIADSAKRAVKLQGAINFRDVGGYRTANGKTVKWGKVFRSADVSRLTDSDLQVMAARHINTIIDLRETKEAAKAPDRLLPYTDYTLSASSEEVGDFMAAMRNLERGDSLMTTFYSKIDHFETKYKAMFQKLLVLPDTSALMFHCTAGKDRTGVGTALFLNALGVPYATIEKDYLATDYYRAGANDQAIAMVKQMGIKEQVMKDMMGVRPEYLQATFNAIRKQYGTMDVFYKQVLGLGSAELKQLKAKYTL